MNPDNKEWFNRQRFRSPVRKFDYDLINNELVSASNDADQAMKDADRAMKDADRAMRDVDQAMRDTNPYYAWNYYNGYPTNFRSNRICTIVYFKNGATYRPRGQFRGRYDHSNYYQRYTRFQNGRNTIVCFQCGEAGHKSPQCYHRGFIPPCMNCGVEGHVADFCYARVSYCRHCGYPKSRKQPCPCEDEIEDDEDSSDEDSSDEDEAKREILPTIEKHVSDPTVLNSNNVSTCVAADMIIAEIKSEPLETSGVKSEPDNSSLKNYEKTYTLDYGMGCFLDSDVSNNLVTVSEVQVKNESE